MSANATLKHEHIFERHLIGLVGGGLAAGVVASILELIVGRGVEALGALSFAAVVGLVINQLDPREDTALMRLVLALTGGVLMAGVAGLGFWAAPWWAAMVGGGFLGAALTFDRAQSRGRKWWTWALFGAALPAGVFTAETLFQTGFLQPLDASIVRHALEGTVWGVFMAVAAGMSDLEWDRDSSVGKLDEAIARHRDPVRDYLESAKELYRQVVRECERAEQDDTRRRALEIAADTVSSLLRFAARFDELRSSLQRSNGERLKRRLERMERRLAEAESRSVARELEQARAQIIEQVQMRQRLDLACARLESSLQRSLTTLEKLHLTLVQHATSTSNDAGLTESLSSLEQLAEEVEFKNLSVDELCEMDALESGEDPTSTLASDVDKATCYAHSDDASDGRDGALDVSGQGADLEASAEDAQPAPSGAPDNQPDHQEEKKHEQVVCEHDTSC
jgi:hypothetical protein